jgi:TetR/AcrR family transcriptional regulator, mexJK operon transcriptional repressor
MPPTRQAVPKRRGQPNKRQNIVDAAKRVFFRDGFTNASIDAIVAEAGVSRQTIYNNFSGKEELFATVVRDARSDESAESDAASIEEILANSVDLGRDLRELGHRWVATVLREDVVALRRLIVAEWDRHPELLEEWKRPRRDLERALTRGIVHQAKRGALDIEDADRAARQLMLLVITESLTRSLYGMRRLSDAELDDIVGSGVDMWLRCYKARPAGLR